MKLSYSPIIPEAVECYFDISAAGYHAARCGKTNQTADEPSSLLYLIEEF